MRRGKGFSIDFSDLTRNVKKDIELTEKQLLQLAQKTTLDAQAALVLATPVDTGTARRGWQAITPTQPYQDGAVENNVEYLGKLNDGHSSQAPANFIENVCERISNGGT